MTLLLAALLYLGIGAGLGMTALRLPALRRRIAAVAAGRGMDLGYARAVWLGGTAIAWPIGLYVLATGRLLLVPAQPSGETLDQRAPREKQGAPLLD